MILTDAQKKFITEEEGFNVPWKVPPLRTSGITIGYGYDLGQTTDGQFKRDWQKVLSADDIVRLGKFCGPRWRGNVAIAASHDASLRSVNITPAMALQVLEEKSWPKYEADANIAFPGLDQLVDDAQFALTSLVYNRGGRLDETDWDHPENWRRSEMRAIRDAVKDRHLPNIADGLVLMSLLWAGKGVPGLVKRRLREAKLVDPKVEARIPSLLKDGSGGYTASELLIKLHGEIVAEGAEHV